jgi:hypothetical protein
MDFPLIFGITWVIIIIVVAVKLFADLLETTYNYSTKTTSSIEQNLKESALRFAVPKGWLIFGLALCAFIALIAIMAPLLAPYGGNAIHLKDSLSPPSAKYILGTDQLGRDIFSRLLWGMRIDVLIGLVCAAVVSVIAFGWATLAAYCRKMNNWLCFSMAGTTPAHHVFPGRYEYCICRVCQRLGDIAPRRRDDTRGLSFLAGGKELAAECAAVNSGDIHFFNCRRYYLYLHPQLLDFRRAPGSGGTGKHPFQ